MDIFGKIATHLVQIGLYIMAILPIPYLTVLSIVYRSSWLIYLLSMVVLMFYWQVYNFDTDNSIGGLIGTALFAWSAFAYMVTIFEAIFKHSKYRKIRRLQQKVDTLLEQHFKIIVSESLRHSRLMRKIFMMLITIFICESVRIWINIHFVVSPVLWYSLPIEHGLRMRYIQIIMIAMEVNERMYALREVVFELAQYNKPKSKYTMDIWLPYASWEYDQLNIMRLIFGRLHEIYSTINSCFGWSILIIFTASFLNFVCNAYWVIMAILNNGTLNLIFNVATTFPVGSLVAALFWYTDASDSNSNYIGCIISKLVKPMGNKHYNDLVTGFSLQILQQQFVITAKGVFNLNRYLFGSMTAAIVTYLVILLQFYFTVNAKEENTLINLMTMPNLTRNISIL